MPHSLWLLSTTGEGDAPDHALGFVQQLPQPAAAAGHQSLVLALGDREYQEFCAFGVEVHEWLQTRAPSEVVCVDSGHAQAGAQRWQMDRTC
jgi:sulfite reductase (NADPH) flavoprotein alpha-component